MRILAQGGMDWDQGFFAVDNGPIYEDQKWRLQLQEDGSYAIVNMRSGRRVLARSGSDGGTGFAAIRSDGPIREEERWWLINQERDEGGKWLLELDAAMSKNARLGEQFKVKVGEALSLTSELKSAHVKFNQVLATHQSEAEQLTQRVLVEKRVNMKLAEQVVATRNETLLIRSDLQMEKDAKARLVEERDTALGKLHAVNLQMQVEKSAKEVLMEEVEAKKGVLGCLWRFPMDDPVLHTCKLVLLTVALVFISIFLPYLRHRLQAAHCRATTLAAELSTARAAKGHLAEENAKKQARIAELEHSLERLEAPANPHVDLGFDFAYRVFNMELDQSTMRFIKIQCPGVAHEDIEVQLIFNGCEVTIARKASQGVEAITWRRQFYWKPSEGLFEFKEDQMQLEHGFLHLVFKAYTYQTRVIRFPQHFNLDSGDNDGCWDFEADENEDALNEFWGETTDLTLMKPDSYIDTESTASTRRKSTGQESTASTPRKQLDFCPPSPPKRRRPGSSSSTPR